MPVACTAANRDAVVVNTAIATGLTTRLPFLRANRIIDP